MLFSPYTLSNFCDIFLTALTVFSGDIESPSSSRTAMSTSTASPPSRVELNTCDKRYRRNISFPFMAATVEFNQFNRRAGFCEKSWLLRHFTNLLGWSHLEGGVSDVTNSNGTYCETHPDENSTKSRLTLYEPSSYWMMDDECSVDASIVYRQQLRSILREKPSLSDIFETDISLLTRSLSEGDLRRVDEENNVNESRDVFDRYGLLSSDYGETLCIPEGTVVGDEVCYITGAFLESLERPNSETVSITEAETHESPATVRFRRVEEHGQHISLSSDLNEELEDKDMEPVDQMNTVPQRKRSRGVSAIIFERLTKRKPKLGSQDLKLKRDSFKVTLIMINAQNQPLWARFDLFSKDEYTSWHDKYRHDKMNTKVLKKQDAIFELILIEKAHCSHLAFLQQAYRNRLIQENILPEADVDRLIPDVLDALLVFHLNLLDRLTARQRECDEVETISDILAEELSDDGKHIGIAVNAYTTFGSAKERSEKMFESLMAKNGRFAEFIRTSAQDSMYRRFEFKSIMTRIISRPAKYGLLVETILKNECNKFTKEWELTQKALFAAKRFAMRIDNNLLMMQMAQRWDDVRSHFDLSSHTNLYIIDKEKPSGVVRITFTMEDLDIDVKHPGSGQRRLMCLGDVCMKNSRTKTAEKVFMVLFDDILVCLQRRNNHQKYVFIQQDQSVFPVSGLILRPADRSASVMIISGAITKPALLEVEFNSKTDRTKWIKTLESAIHNAPAKVRLSPRNEDEAARQLELERQLQLKQQKEAEDAWLRKLDEMFEQRNSQERFIQDYMISLMKFFDDLRAHLHTLPLKSRPDVADRIREAVRQHCRELRVCRTAPLSRRSTIRRHTTVPRMSICQDGVGDRIDEDEERWEFNESRREQLEVEEKTHQLPLGLNLKARRAMSRLIRDVVKLKSENNHLRSEISLNKTRLAMKERTQNAMISPSLASDTMEALRRKEQEVREENARRRQELEQWAEELRVQQERQRQQEEQMLLQHERLRQNEVELANKWAALHAATVAGCTTPETTPRIAGRISMKSPSSLSKATSFRDPK
uniref:DH domain-containing protein n=1 Tax=Angiostrongylus cantonensis TaxID=6313 RepID=A0A158P7M3_ANGCA